MLHPEINNRDIIIFALYQIERIIDTAIKDIMEGPERFLSLFKLFEYYNFPKEA